MKIPRNLTKREQETFFRTDAAAKEWQFYSRDPKFKRLLERRGYTVTEDHQGLWAANVPLKALTLRSKKAVTAKPTDEQRLKGSRLVKRPLADAALSASDQTNGNFVSAGLKGSHFRRCEGSQHQLGWP